MAFGACGAREDTAPSRTTALRAAERTETSTSPSGRDPATARTVTTTGAPATTETALTSTTTLSRTTAPPPTTTLADCSAEPAALPPPPALRPRYVVSMTIADDLASAVGELAVTFHPDLDTDRLVMRLWPNGPRQAEGGNALTATVTALTVDGAPRGVTANLPDPTTLEVAGPFLAGQRVEAHVAWRLQLGAEGDDRLGRGLGWARMGSFLPLLAWEPGVGWATEPPTRGFAEASSFPAADIDLTVASPPGMTVLATGSAVGGGRFVGTGVRDVGLSVGTFMVVQAVASAPGPVEVTVGVQQGMADDPAVYARRVVAALEDFGRRFGPYPWGSLSVAITPQLGGGIEYPGHVMQGPATDGRTTPHEVAHQWFYGLVGNNQGRDPVIDEGLASYAEFTFEGLADQALGVTVPDGAAGRAGQPMTYWDSSGSAYYAGVYVQGAQALLALGTAEQVDCVLRRLVAARAFRTATEADLVAAAETEVRGASAILAGYGISAG